MTHKKGRHIQAEQTETLHPKRITGLPKGPTLKLKRAQTLLSDPGDKVVEASAQACLDELRRLAESEPDRVISRNWFRLNSNLSERAWNVHFGTFAEYKRQAGIVLTRQQHNLEKQLARHASVDHYRELSVEQTQYAEKYLRPNSKRFKLIMGVADVHDKDCDPFCLRVMLDTAKRAQPDVICFNGDLFDLPEFGRFTQDPRDWDVVGRIKFVHEKIFAPLRKSCPNAQIDLIGGNHECLSLDTEVLTEAGWILAPEVTTESVVASYETQTGCISYSKPLELAMFHEQPMVEVKGDLADELVSIEHRVDVGGKLTPVRELLGKKLDCTEFRYAGSSDTPGALRDGALLTEDWMRLLVWTVCDGTIVRRSLSNMRIQFKLSYQKKIDRLRALLNHMGIPFTFRPATMSVGNVLQPYCIRIYGDYAREIDAALSASKAFPQDWADALNAGQTRWLIDELRFTDGSDCYNHVTWSSTSKSDVDTVQLACVRNGIPFSISSVKRNSGFPNAKPIWMCRIFSKGLCQKRKVRIEATGTTASVVAIQTVNGTLITRRNGKVSFTGNCRLLRHLADSTPAMRAVLSDLHGMTIAKLLGLDTYEVNYVSRGDMAAFNSADIKRELMKNHRVYYDCFLAHHYPEGRQLGLPGFCGHHHKLLSWPMKSAVLGSYNFYQVGAMHRQTSTYCDGENWSSGFLLAHIDSHTKRSVMEYVDIKDFAVVGGRYYQRQETEV